MASPCSEDLVCRNGDFIQGEALSKCALCRLSPDNKGRDMAHYWSPTKPVAGMKHPELVAEKRTQKITKRLLKLIAKSKRDPLKRKVLRKAAQAEKKTEAQIIHATKNSGRRNKDGDHVQGGVITLDTKLQTTRENPVILLSELEKVRSDATRAGTWLGGLVIRNKHGVGCVVFKEEDYAELTRRLLYPSERTNDEQVGSKVSRNGQAGGELVERPKH